MHACSSLDQCQPGCFDDKPDSVASTANFSVSLMEGRASVVFTRKKFCCISFSSPNERSCGLSSYRIHVLGSNSAAIICVVFQALPVDTKSRGRDPNQPVLQWRMSYSTHPSGDALDGDGYFILRLVGEDRQASERIGCKA